MSFSYKFGNKTYTSLEELGKELSASWELAKFHLDDEELIKSISNIDPMLGNKVDVCRRIVNKDRAVFVLQYLFSNTLPFSYKGLVFEDLSKMGIEILNRAPFIIEKLEEVLRYGLLSDFMKLKDFDNNYPKHYEEVVEIEKEFQNNPLVCYFRLGFLLSEDKGIRYDGRIFTDQSAFFNYLLAYDRVADFVAIEWNVPFLSAWLEIQGLTEENRKWNELISIIEAWK